MLPASMVTILPVRAQADGDDRSLGQYSLSEPASLMPGAVVRCQRTTREYRVASRRPGMPPDFSAESSEWIGASSTLASRTISSTGESHAPSSRVDCLHSKDASPQCLDRGGGSCDQDQSGEPTDGGAPSDGWFGGRSDEGVHRRHDYQVLARRRR